MGRKRNIVISLLMMLACITGEVSGQCKSFVKKTCMPNISPFTHNGQMNTTTLHAGQKAEMQMTFYKGQNYRILVCAQDMLGDIYFNVFDMNKKVIFTSKGKTADSWDFNVTSTQDMIVEVIIPVSDPKKQIVPSGCVSLLVGFKK